MLHRSTHFLSTTIIAATFALGFAGSALAGNSTDSTSTPAGGTTAAAPASTESSKAPVDTSTTSKPPVQTSAPVTEVPATVAPVTVTPVTVTPATAVPATAVPATAVVEQPSTPEVPAETCLETPNAAQCLPETPNAVPGVTPQAPGGGDLPFTGPGDVVLAIVIALLAGTGGALFMFGAAGREQLDVLNRRGMDSPSGFHLAYRELRKQQAER